MPCMLRRLRVHAHCVQIACWLHVLVRTGSAVCSLLSQARLCLYVGWDTMLLCVAYHPALPIPI